MKAVILAAGSGRRLLPLTRRLPKTLIRVGGRTLLERSLNALAQRGITESVVVIGHLGEKIRRLIGDRYHGIRVEYVRNPRDTLTGSMHSLFQAREVIDGDILLLESDLLYAPAALDAIIDSPHPNAILVAGLLHSGDDVYVCINESGEVVNLGKHLADADRDAACGALVGISKFSLSFLQRLFARAEEDPRPYPSRCHYEEYVFETSLQGAPLYAVICEDLSWIEIDTLADLRRARKQILPRLRNGRS